MPQLLGRQTRKLTIAALAASVLAMMLSTTAVLAQASGATDVDVNLPDIVILHYFSNVDITITSGAFGTFLTGTPGDQAYDEGTVAPAAGGFTQDLGIGPSPLTGDPSAAVLTLQRAWAVRAISLGGGTDTELTIANTDPTLDHTSTAATIVITGVAVDDGTSNGSTITFSSPGVVNAARGDVELTLDLSNASNAGDYVDGVFTLTATNI